MHNHAEGHKSVGLLIFKRAMKDKIIPANTFMKDAMPEDAVGPKDTKWYTVDEAEAIIAALERHADCQLVMSLCCFLGLRPGKSRGFSGVMPERMPAATGCI